MRSRHRRARARPSARARRTAPRACRARRPLRRPRLRSRTSRATFSSAGFVELRAARLDARPAGEPIAGRDARSTGRASVPRTSQPESSIDGEIDRIGAAGASRARGRRSSCAGPRPVVLVERRAPRSAPPAACRSIVTTPSVASNGSVAGRLARRGAARPRELAGVVADPVAPRRAAAAPASRARRPRAPTTVRTARRMRSKLYAEPSSETSRRLRGGAARGFDRARRTAPHRRRARRTTTASSFGFSLELRVRDPRRDRDEHERRHAGSRTSDTRRACRARAR